LLSLGFMLLHAIVLMLDKVAPMSLVEILVPFASNYRPLWIGIGIIAFDLSILVTVTFCIYLKSTFQVRNRTIWITVKYLRYLQHHVSNAGFVNPSYNGFVVSSSGLIMPATGNLPAMPIASGLELKICITLP
jgi:hypothetical protein